MDRLRYRCFRRGLEGLVDGRFSLDRRCGKTLHHRRRLTIGAMSQSILVIEPDRKDRRVVFGISERSGFILGVMGWEKKSGNLIAWTDIEHGLAVSIAMNGGAIRPIHNSPTATNWDGRKRYDPRPVDLDQRPVIDDQIILVEATSAKSESATRKYRIIAVPINGGRPSGLVRRSAADSVSHGKCLCRNESRCSSRARAVKRC
jgi:hypothetical protein